MRLLWILIERLSYEPKSLWRAKYLADSPPINKLTKAEPNHMLEWYGWDTQATVLAGVYDKLDVILDAIIKHGAKNARIKLSNPYPRPGTNSRHVATSTDDLFNFFGVSSM